MVGVRAVRLADEDLEQRTAAQIHRAGQTQSRDGRHVADREPFIASRIVQNQPVKAVVPLRSHVGHGRDISLNSAAGSHDSPSTASSSPPQISSSVTITTRATGQAR